METIISFSFIYIVYCVTKNVTIFNLENSKSQYIKKNSIQ